MVFTFISLYYKNKKSKKKKKEKSCSTNWHTNKKRPPVTGQWPVVTLSVPHFLSCYPITWSHSWCSIGSLCYTKYLFLFYLFLTLYFFFPKCHNLNQKLLMFNRGVFCKMWYRCYLYIYKYTFFVLVMSMGRGEMLSYDIIVCLLFLILFSSSDSLQQ